MNKAWLVARREYLYNLRRPAFLFGAFVMPLIIVVIIAIVFFINASTQTNPEALGQVGYVDEAGVLTRALQKPDVFSAYDSVEAAQADLDGGVIGGYFVVAPDYMQTGNVRIVSLQTIPSAVERSIDRYLIANLDIAADDLALVERVTNPVTMTVHTLDSGRTITSAGIIGLFAMPVIFGLVFYMATQTTSGYLMSSVVEEKTNRIMEILITSVTPLELLLGKIVGLGLVGLTQLVVWLVAAAVGLSLGRNLEFLEGVILPLDLVIVSLVYFLLSYFLYAGIMAGIGASTGSEQESRQVASIFGIIAVIPFFFFNMFLFDPENSLITALTLIPFTAPLTVIMRMSLSYVPPGELALSVGLLLLTTVFAVWASARVFRWASLLYGKRVTPREIWRVIRGSNTAQIGTVAATHEEQTA